MPLYGILHIRNGFQASETLPYTCVLHSLDTAAATSHEPPYITGVSWNFFAAVTPELPKHYN